MEQTRLGAVEMRFAELIWAHAPLSSGELVRLCEQQLAWKKSTTYTVLKKLCDRGLFENHGGTVRVLVTQKQLQAMQSEQFVDQTFSGSLPAFLAAFTTRKKLTQEEINEIRRMIDTYGEE